jgi:hypothetical protein
MAWLVKDFADGWTRFQKEEEARAEAERTDAALLHKPCPSFGDECLGCPDCLGVIY